MAEPSAAKPGPRVRIVGDGTYKTKVFVGDQMLVNCVGVELTLDPARGVSGVLHLIDVEVDLDLFGPDMVVMVQPLDDPVSAGLRGAAAMDALKIAAEGAAGDPPSPSRRSTAIATHFTADDARAIAREVKAAEERHNALTRGHHE